MRKKVLVAVMGLAAAIAVSCSSLALPVSSYENVYNEYGEKREEYARLVDVSEGVQTSILYIPWEDVTCEMDVNMRSTPSKDSELVTTIPASSHIRIWSVCDNGWDKAVYIDPQGKANFGYLKSDFLFPLPEQPQTEAEAPAQETEAAGAEAQQEQDQTQNGQ